MTVEMTAWRAADMLENWPKGYCPIDSRPIAYHGEIDEREHRWAECDRGHHWPMQQLDRGYWTFTDEDVTEKLAEYAETTYCLVNDSGAAWHMVNGEAAYRCPWDGCGLGH